jgi:homoserine dehydrogenase
LSQWREQLKEGGKPGTLDDVASHLVGSGLPNTVIVDCTASDYPPSQYEKWMKQGIHVVTPNKKLGSGPYKQYSAVRQLTRNAYTHWYYEVRESRRHVSPCTQAGAA